MNEEQLKRVKQLLNEINNLSRQTGFSNPFAQDKRFISDESIRALKETSKIFQELTSYTTFLKQELSSVGEDLTAIATSINRTLDEISKSGQGESINILKRNLRSLRGITDSIKLDYDEISKLDSKQLDNLDKRLGKTLNQFEGIQGSVKLRKEELFNQIQLLQLDKERGIISKSKSRELDKIISQYDDIITAERVLQQETVKGEEGLSSYIKKRIDLRKKEEEQIREAEGFTGVAVDSAQGVLGAVGLGSLSKFIDLEGIRGKVREESEKLVGKNYLRRFIGQTGIAFKTMGRVGVGAFKSLLNPATLVIGLIKGIGTAISTAIQLLKELDKETGELAKNFNLSYQEAVKLRVEMAKIAISTDDVFVNSKALLDTLTIINKTTGTAVFSGLGKELEQSVVFLTQLEQRAKLGADSIQQISELMFVTGRSAEDLVRSFTSVVTLLNLENNTDFVAKDIFKEISEFSDATLLSLSQYKGAIADAFYESKLLGVSLSQVDRISEGLLDFQSSIKNEIEAIVVSGRQLNLNAARFYALNNDTAGVAREINKQAGSAVEFAEMNRIAQNKIAQSLGFTRDELAKTLFIQEQLDQLSGVELTQRKLLLKQKKEELSTEEFIKFVQQDNLSLLASQVSTAERYNAAITRLKDSLTPLLGPIASAAEELAAAFEAIALNPSGAFDTIKQLTPEFKALTGYLSIMSDLSSKVGTRLTGIWDRWTGRVKTLIEAPEKIYDIFETLTDRIKSLFDSFELPQFIKDAMSFLSGLSGKGQDLYSRAKESTGPRINAISNDVSNLAREAKDKVMPGAMDFYNNIKSDGSRLIDKGSDVIQEGLRKKDSLLQEINTQYIQPIINTIGGTQSSEQTSEIIKSNEKVIAAIKELGESNKQDAAFLAKAKQKLVVGATEFGTQLGVSSYSVQYG